MSSYFPHLALASYEACEGSYGLDISSGITGRFNYSDATCCDRGLVGGWGAIVHVKSFFFSKKLFVSKKKYEYSERITTYSDFFLFKYRKFLDTNRTGPKK